MAAQRISSRPKRTRQRFALATLVALAPVAGCKRVSRNEVAKVQTAPLTATAVHVRARQIPVVLMETGSFVADESSDVASPVAGRVIRTPIAVGAFVKAGEVICELDPRDAEFKLLGIRAQLAEATAGVKQAQQRIGLGTATFDATLVPEVAAAKAAADASAAQAKLAAADAKRYASLVASGDVSQTVYEQKSTQADTAAAQASQARQQYQGALNAAKLNFHAVGSSESALDAMRAQVQEAEKAVSDTRVRAPFDGYVSARPVAVGEFVSTSTKVATVVRIRTLKLQMQVPERSAAGVTVGMPVQARVAAYGEREFEGTTSAVNPAVNPDSRAFVLEARFANNDNTLRPGMFARARVVLPGAVQGIFVPAVAVVRDRTIDSNQVFVLEGNKARLRVVTTGDMADGQVQVLSGLSGDEVVLLPGNTAFFDGEAVHVDTGR